MILSTVFHRRVTRCFRKFSIPYRAECYGFSTVSPEQENKSDQLMNDSSSNFAFDREIKRLQKNGAATAYQKYREHDNATKEKGEGVNFVNYDYFHIEIANRLVDRMDDINREGGFPLALDVGSGPGFLHQAICADEAFSGVGGIGGIRKLVQIDSNHAMLQRDEHEVQFEGADRCGTYRMNSNEEGKLPFPSGTFDIVLSSMSLHWINDLPGLFSEIKRVLKPDGCFMFAMVGGATLTELRSSLVLAELERDGGVSSHVGPFVDFNDVGTLVSNAGFTLPTVDIDTVKVSFPNAMVLMEHLQRMGEGNASLNKKERVSISTFLASACIYDNMYKLQTDQGIEEEEVEVSVQVIYAIGWAPDDSQPKPKERGSATHKVGEIVLDRTSKLDPL